MRNIKISTKIVVGFSCVFVFLLIIAVTAVSSAAMTGSNIGMVDLYNGLQNNANALIHILNETRVSAATLYASHAAGAYSNVAKQVMYCDLRLKLLYEYIDAHPQLAGFRKDIESYDALYSDWRDGLFRMNSEYDLTAELTPEQLESFTALSEDLRKTNLLAHEVLSNTISDIDFVTSQNMADMKGFNLAALWIVVAISVVSLIAAILMARVIMRSITIPIGLMRDVLNQIGQTGNLLIPGEMERRLRAVAAGRDETAQCTAELLVMTDRLNSIDKALSHVAEGDLTVGIELQSSQDTIGLAVREVLRNLNQKFGTIAQSMEQVNRKAQELSDGSRLLASGTQDQAESVAHLSDSVRQVSQITEKNTSLASEASSLAGRIQNSARIGSDKMNQMIQAVTDINDSSKVIGKVIKVIDDIAFQTNILSLNASVEAARAGAHGKGFSVVADEVRNLAAKSAEAARDTSVLIEDTIKKAALGASIAADTSHSFEEIVDGVDQSNSIIEAIAALSQEQSTDTGRITADVAQVESIVEQNNSISAQSAAASSEISDQTNLLMELVKQFRLLENAGDSRQGGSFQ